MESNSFLPDASVSLFVKNVLVFGDDAPGKETVLPFYADGYPGLLFHETESGLVVHPHDKRMPPLFLYGQTLKPIELAMTGRYRLVVFQLYPFVLKGLFGVDPGELNDDCYDVGQLGETAAVTTGELQRCGDNQERIAILTGFIDALFRHRRQELDLPIATAIDAIIREKGQLAIGSLPGMLCLTERTFERRFRHAVGLTAKQFARIIQFQHALGQLKGQDYTKLSDIVYANGFADQSHFIKVFRAFTGTTPLAFPKP